MKPPDAPRHGLLGGAFAVLIGSASLALNGAVIAYIAGWFGEPASDAERLDVAFAALAVLPILGVMMGSTWVVALGIAAIRDARGARTGRAAGWLMVMCGVIASWGVRHAVAGSWVALVVAGIGGVGTWLNGTAWWASRGAATERIDPGSSG